MSLPDVVHDWFLAEARDLPWRRAETTPWGVMVSEFMLQQTPVARVEPVWTAWMATWPTPAALAAASRADVLRAWGKLGYPRRALRLHAAAEAIRDQHGGAVPSVWTRSRRCPASGRTPRGRSRRSGTGGGARWSTRTSAGWSRGPSTARATRGPRGLTADLADVDALLPAAHARAAVISAGLMELGAVVCTARAPRCGGCPVRDLCAWRRRGPPRVHRPAQGRPDVRGHRPAGPRPPPRRPARRRDPVERAALDAVWADAAQRDRCLFSLLEDGLTEQLPDGRFALPA